jgi:nitrogen fixation/metabolism regulation signal transduction histidine kinase
MPPIKSKNRILFLAILFALSYSVAYMLDRGKLFWNPHETHLGFSIPEITAKIAERTADVDSIIADISKLVDNKQINREILSDIASLINGKKIENKAYTFLLYENNQLKFWSNTQINVPAAYADSVFMYRILRTGNGFYLVNKKLEENRIIIGLSLIKNEYPIANEYLKPKYFGEFKIPENVKIETDIQALGIDVADVDGRFLFKLMPEYSTFLEKPYFFSSIVFYLLGILFFLMFVYYAFKYLLLFLNDYLVLLALIALLFLLRYFSILYKIPANMYHLSVFKPQYFSQSFWFASLGDFIFNALIFFFIAFFIKRNISFYKLHQKWPVHIFMAALILSFYFDLSSVFINNLIQNSSINFELYKILSLDGYSLGGYIIIALIFGALWLLVEKYVQLAIKETPKLSVFVLIISVLITILVSFAGNQQTYYPGFAFLFFFTASVYFVRSKYAQGSYFSTIFLVILISLYTVFLILKDVEEKASSREQVIAINLAAERDPIAELFFIEKENVLKADTFILSELNGGMNANKIRRHIYDKYLKGYLNKFDLQVTICLPKDSLWIEDEGRTESCNNYFQNAIDFTGSKLRQSDFYFLDNLNGRISYFGWLRFKNKASDIPISLFLEFDSKLQIDETGYPELLLDKKLSGKSKYKDYQYAKYKFGQLINQHGDYPYDLKLSLKEPEDAEFFDYRKNGFHHLVYWLDSNNVIVVSRKQNSFMDYLITFSYLFLAFNLLVSLLLLSDRLLHGKFRFYFDLKLQIQFSMVATLIISLLIVGGGTVFYILKLYQNKHNENLNEKIQSLNNELSHKLLYEASLSPNWRNYDNNSLNDLLMKFADVLYTDVHLFDNTGNLLATSRPELFNMGLQSRLMNFDAYNQLVLEQRQKYQHEEKIGELNYLSAYLPFRNVDNKILAYMNLPYFSKQSEMRAEISALLVTVLNVFVLLILIATFVALFTSNRITLPLQLLQSSMREIELGKSNQPIHYQRNDEIGQLVKEYNRMLGELHKSAELLGQSERESAWREMAKQIAHEIKNPLTPMKLSIQYLQRSWKNKDKDFDARLERVALTMVQQIDALSEIATAFSNFAKMPRSQMQVVNLLDVIKNVIRLFKDTEDVEIDLQENSLESVSVFIDEKEMQRVFINLVKNGIQSVSKERNAQIGITIAQNNEHVVVAVRDNGAGIPEELHEKLFRPNFTTKTTGMGLGLAIVKNIVDNEKGKIWFETALSKGSTFFVQLPVVPES